MVLGDRYRALEVVAPGRPFRARDAATAQTVVIHTLGDAGSVAARARSLIGVFHPSLITLFDIFEIEPGTFAAACEFVVSQPLERVMAGLPFHRKRAAEIAAEIADGVAELHARGFAHGAISTTSVVLTAKGKAKLGVVAAIALPHADEHDDLRALEGVATAMAGRNLLEGQAANSAAVLAARFRALNLRAEPSG